MTNQKKNYPLILWGTLALFFAVLFVFIFFRHSRPSSSIDEEQKIALESKELTPQKRFLLAIQEKKEALNPFRGNPDAISVGKNHFRVICSKCHHKDAGGDTGPDLTDDTWLHGSGDLEVYMVIMEGVSKNEALQEPFRGAMPAYSSMLGVTKVLEVMAWVASVNPSWSGKPRPVQ